MKFFLFIFLYFLLQLPLFAQQPDIPCYDGLYKYGTGAKKGSIGSLMIHRESDTTLLFHLDVNRGAPSYNSGETYGRMKLYKDSGVYHFADTAGVYDCGLIFMFKKSRITIRYIQDSVMHTECGYGFSVYAAGTYYLKVRKTYSAFKNGEQTSILFNTQTVDEWEKSLGKKEN